MSLHYFSNDNTLNMEILITLRISMSVPILFKPVHYENKVWIDGGCLNNFPIELFDDCLENIIGIYLGSKDDEIIEKFNNMQDY